MVMECSSPDVGDVVDFPVDWPHLYSGHVIRHFSIFSGGQVGFVAAEDTMR